MKTWRVVPLVLIPALIHFAAAVPLCSAGPSAPAASHPARPPQPARIEVLRGQGAAVTGMAFSPADHLLVSSGEDGSVRLWDARTGDAVRTLVESGEPVEAVAISADGRRAAAAGHDGRISVFDAPSGQKLHTLSIPTFWCLGLALSPDGRLAACSSTGQLSVWQVESGELVQTLTTWSGVLAWSPDGRFLAAGSTVIDLWDTQSWRKAKTMGGHAGEIRGLAFSPDGHHLATASIDTTARIWDVDTGERTWTLRTEAVNLPREGPSGDPVRLPVLAVAFSPDGKRLVTGGTDRTVRLWDVASGKLLQTLTGHSMTVTGVAFLEDGKRIASSSLDHTIRLWDVAAD
jgi:WD40 repeat protein